jgi:DNA-binding phage protein
MEGPSYYSQTPLTSPEGAALVMRDILRELDREWVCVVNMRVYHRIWRRRNWQKKQGLRKQKISRLENGTRNPSIKLLQRLADGMDMVFSISFTPKAKTHR